jgi:hypothetical protein
VSTVAMSAAEETCLGLLVMAGLWAVFSGACVVASAHTRERRASWGWASSFLAASLVAAYCFGRLL